MTTRELTGPRLPRPSARGTLVAWAGFLAASATILAVCIG